MTNPTIVNEQILTIQLTTNEQEIILNAIADQLNNTPLNPIDKTLRQKLIERIIG